MIENIDLVCPNCLADLNPTPEHVSCSQCDTKFDVVDGIPVLRQNADTYYGEFPQDEMRQLLSEAEEDLEGSIRNYLRSKDAAPRLGEYILGRGRAGWQYLLPISNDSKVLDLGCGWGTLAWGLAQFSGHVVACDSTLERMQLLGIRKRNEQLKNLQLVCAGDAKHLPFPDDSFDAVVINGVLEWVPSGLPGDPEEVQKVFLREVRRVLKPNGCLFLGIENRHAWKTWVMNKDGHTGLRFVPWLPRVLAHAYSRVRGKGSYRNYLYSRRGYEKLLGECGFDDASFHIPWPGYHHPVKMLPFDGKKDLKNTYTRAEKGFLAKRKQWLKGVISAYFPDAFGIVAGGGGKPSFIIRLLEHVAECPEINLGRNPHLNYRMNGEMGIVTVIATGSEGAAVVKLPLHARGLEELRAEAEILSKAASGNLELPTYLFAKLLKAGEFEGLNYFVHSILPGVSGDKLRPGETGFHKAVSNAADFLAKLHNDSVKVDATLEQLVETTQNQVSKLACNSKQRANIELAVKRVLEACSDGFEGAVWAHGDSKLANFMFDPETYELTGAIDWGTGFQPELPGYDFSFLCVSSEAVRKKISLVNELREQMGNGLPEHLQAEYEKYSKLTGIIFSNEYYRALVTYQWLKRLAPLADGYETMRYNHHYLDSMFELLD